jgi:FKBP-type peptidyl-prolyl cis-trans isomerase
MIKNTAMRLWVGIMAAITVCCACQTSKKVAAVTANADNATVKQLQTDTFTMLPSGLQYRIIKHGNGKRKPILNDKAEMQLRVVLNGRPNQKDSVIFDTRTMNDGKPVSLQIQKPKFKGDPMEVYMYLVTGDSAEIFLPVDSIKKNGSQVPSWIQDGKAMQYNVALLSIKNDSEARVERDMQTAYHKIADDSILRDYLSAHKLFPLRTQSGLYVSVTDSGTGRLPKIGDVLSVYYTASVLNGNIFETNQDATFHAQEPVKIELGRGKVIKGWEEGLFYLKKNGKGTFYIPSHLGYGSRPHGNVPPYSIIVYDVYVKDMLTQEETDSVLLNNYFAENHIKPQKTASGLYYTINKKGKGAYATIGKRVSVRYTGKLLDGTVFDSNADTAEHKNALEFEIGGNNVIKGWEEGLSRLNVGSEATFYVPSSLGYGRKGLGKKIPPNAVLIFEMKLVGLK